MSAAAPPSPARPPARPRRGGTPAPRALRGGVLLLVVGLVLAATAFAGRFLVVNDARPSDVIVVLDGEYNARPGLALAELRAGMAPRAILDVDTLPVDIVYGHTVASLAAGWIAALPPALRGRVSLCTTNAESTRREAEMARACLTPTMHRVLLVTSEFHTRRALSVFRHVAAGHVYTAAGAVDPREFGVDWWKHRQWAKRTVDEWSKLLWWQLVERWI